MWRMTPGFLLSELDQYQIIYTGYSSPTKKIDRINRSFINGGSYRLLPEEDTQTVLKSESANSREQI